MMNLLQIADYIRVHWSSFRRNLYGEWKDIPRESVTVKYKDKAGKNRSRIEYKFNLEKVLKYFEDKYNQIK